MLESLRKGAKSWVAKVLIVLLIASFAVWGIGDAFTTRLDSAVAEVGDQRVTVDAYADALVRQRGQLSQRAGQAVSYAEMRRYGIDRQILARLVRDAAFRAELARLGIAVPDTAVAEAIRTNPAFQSSSGGFSDPAYRLAVSRIGLSPAEFEALTRTLLGQEMLTEAAVAVAEPVPGFAARLAAYQGEQREIEILLLEPGMAEDPGAPDTEALLAQYTANQDAYYEPERRTGRYLHVDIGALAAANRPADAEIAAYYEANRALYETPATRTIAQLPLDPATADADAAAVRAGEESFEELALRLGETPAALDLGTVERGDLPEAVAEAVFGADAPGIVGPVEAPVGPVLVQVRAVDAGASPSLDEVRDSIAATLAEQAALDRAPQLAAEIEDLRAQGRTLDEIAAETGLVLHHFEGLAQDATLADGSLADGIETDPQFLDEVFTALDLEEREILATGDGGFLLVMVDSIEQRTLPPVEEIRDRVAADWARDRRIEALERRATALADQIGGGRPVSEVAEELGVDPIDLGLVSRASPTPLLPPDLVEALFDVDVGGAAAARGTAGAGVILGTVRAIEMPDPEMLAEMTAEIDEQASGLVRQDTVEYLSRAITAAVPTRIEQGVIEDVFSMIGAAPGSGG